MHRPRNKLLLAAAVAAIAIPALAQESILPPGFGEPAASPTPSPTPTPSPAPSAQPGEGSAVVETGLAGLTPLEAADAMVVEVADRKSVV